MEDIQPVVSIPRLFSREIRGKTRLTPCRDLLKSRIEALRHLVDAEGARAILATISDRLKTENDWTVLALEANLKALAEELGLGLGKLAQPMRAALTGTTTSPGIFDVLALLGREESLARIDAQAAPAAAGQNA